MLSYNEVKERKYIVIGDEPYEVLESHVFRKQQRKPVNQTKLRNLITGGVRAETFHSADTIKEADISKGKVTFLYKKQDRQTGNMEYVFFHDKNRGDRFSLSLAQIGDQAKFIKESQVLDSLIFDDKVIGVSLPLKVKLKVIEAAPAVKGNTATGASKQVTLESGVIINVPLFIKEGDIVLVKVDGGEYSERVSE